MVAEGEQREANVGEDEVLCHEVDEFEGLLGPAARFVGEVDVCVIGLHDATEQHRHNAWGGRDRRGRGDGGVRKCTE